MGKEKAENKLNFDSVEDGFLIKSEALVYLTAALNILLPEAVISVAAESFLDKRIDTASFNRACYEFYELVKGTYSIAESYSAVRDNIREMNQILRLRSLDEDLSGDGDAKLNEEIFTAKTKVNDSMKKALELLRQLEEPMKRDNSVIDAVTSFQKAKAAKEKEVISGIEHFHTKQSNGKR